MPKGFPMSKQVNVLIVDDQLRARQSLKALLTTWPLIGVTQEAANGQEAIQRIEQAQPDLVLMDVRMPVMDGLQATRHVKKHWSQIKVIVLSMYGDYQVEALAAGADAFMSKGESPENVLDRIAKVLHDRSQT
jgi:DNA-binding NarL/FixJ family response regulator